MQRGKDRLASGSKPSKARCSSSAAPAGSLITGAVRLNTLPPRSNTKWLYLATSPEVIVSGVWSFALCGERVPLHGWFASNREVEEALQERRGERVVAVAGIEAVAVELIEGLVLDRDVGRVADHQVVLPAQIRCRASRSSVS